MNAREKIWAWISEHRQGTLVHGNARQIAADTGLGRVWVETILHKWNDDGDVVVLVAGKRRIIAQPDLNGYARAPVWSEEAKVRLAELSATGMPISQIARHMHTTVSAVAGKRQRMKLPKRASPIPTHRSAARGAET